MMAQREQRLVPDRVIGGKYKIIRLLGEGGMGGVYEAENELTRKRVAIKWLHPTLSGSRDAVQRLLREAQACARVRHPHVVDVYDVGQEDDAIFLVMEYLEGETFRSLFARRELGIDALIALLIPAMRGVAAAHAQGIVHRDIKPDNIFLARVPDYATPVPKVLDFGISKVDGRAGEMDTLTQSGVTMGTPLYMSFEQLSGAKDVDARADIYAFGVMLYEAATGRPPFEADSFAALAVKVATTQPVPPRQLSPALDAELEAVVLKAMARERDERFASLEELVAALEPFASPAEARASNPARVSASGPRRVPASAFAATMPEAVDSVPRATVPDASTHGPRRTLAALALVVVAGVGAWAYLRGTGPTPAAAARRDSTPSRAPRAQPFEIAAPPPGAPPLTAPAPTPSTPVAQPTPVNTQVTEPEPRAGRRRASLASTRSAAPEPVAPPDAPTPPREDPAPSAAPEPSATAASSDKGFRAGQPRLDEF